MKIKTNLYPDAADRYLKRFKARGLKMKGRTRTSDHAWYANFPPTETTAWDHAHRSKPEHAARYQDINEVFPPLQSLFKTEEHKHDE